ncbi:MAG: hypothetical protein J07HB67_00130 [halophilic archaeon J07HB67]|nr:MAG: hypothetical protein J07HB67_00130 [halophilic archaeon J07HB67]
MLAATMAAVSAGCIGGDFGQQRGIVSIKLYNPTEQPRETEVTVSDDEDTLLDRQVAVPPRATVSLHNRIVMEQTVTLAATHDGTTTTREWDVQGSMYVTLADDIETQSAVGTPRWNRDDGRVDVTLQTGGDARHGEVTVTRGGTTQFAVDRTVAASRHVTYHDRLDATGEVTVTVDGDLDVTEQLSLADVVRVTAELYGEGGGFVDVNRVGDST